MISCNTCINCPSDEVVDAQVSNQISTFVGFRGKEIIKMPLNGGKGLESGCIKFINGKYYIGEFLPILTISANSNILITYIIVNAEIEEGELSDWEIGFVNGNSPDPTTSDTKNLCPQFPCSYSNNLSGHIRAYAIKGNITIYSANVQL